MKKTFIAVCVAMCVLATATAGQQSKKKLDAILAEVESIEKSLPTYQQTLKELEGVSRRADAEYFASKTGVRKIVARVIGDTGRSDNEYFYRNDKLIYAFHRWTKYDGPISKGAVKAVKVVDTVAFFEAGECLALVIDGKSIGPGTQEWKEEIYSIETTSSAFRSKM